MTRLAVAVCIPSTGTWTAHTAYAAFQMGCYFTSNKVPGYSSQAMALIRTEGSLLSQMRQEMVRHAIQWGATHILFLDSDMVFPRNVLHRLLAHDKPFVAANCTTRMEPIQTVAVGMDGNRVQSNGKSGLEAVQHIGLAVALVEAWVFKDLKPPHFLMDWVPDQKRYCGEDVYFCARLHEAKIPVLIDHDLSIEIQHIGSRPWGHKDLAPPAPVLQTEAAGG